MIERHQEIKTLNKLLQGHPVVGIIGARQVGKTTLAREVISGFQSPTEYFDLENPEDLARLADPMLALKNLSGLVVIDEIQRYPDLFQVLRVLVDLPDSKTKFLILGSASPDLLRQSSETLAGRIIYHQVHGFAFDEVDKSPYTKLWMRGGFPRSFLARSHAASDEWRRAFIQTFLERDLPQLGIRINPTAMRRFWSMIAHYHGQFWNSSEFARSFGVADTTVRKYIDYLTAALVVFQLQPWHTNIKKRQVKAPKVYISDTGLLHSLLNIKNIRDLEGHPKIGASWEGFVLPQIIRRLGVYDNEYFFWATHGGAELDLFVRCGRHRLGFEIKRTSSPKVTPSMRNALSDLKLQRIDVIHAGDKSFPLGDRIRAIAIHRLLVDINPISN